MAHAVQLPVLERPAVPGRRRARQDQCRVADPATCTVLCGGREYARSVLPVFEFGRTVNVLLPAAR